MDADILIGPSNKILEVDLSSQEVKILTVTEKDRKMYLGGKGLGLKLIFDRLKEGTDPLSPENIIAFMPGVMMATGAPCSGRFAAVTKSPLTGIMVCASCGGLFGFQLKTAGWDGILVKGKALEPTYIEITKDGVSFKDAKNVWGIDAISSQSKIVDKKSGAAVVIGPAGENIVPFANIVSGERFLGRGGMGAVMGSKNLKAIVAKGGVYKILPKKMDSFDRAKKLAVKYINSNPMTGESYRNYGTPSNVNPSDKEWILPVNNFATGTHNKAFEISGIAMKEKHNTKHHACRSCSILCGKKGTFDGKSLPVPEFETIGLLGSNIGIFDTNQIAEWNKICADMGMDTISAGGVIAWVMEATEKGLISTNLKFGSPEGVSEALYDIGNAKDFGKEMGRGTRWLAKKYGGSEFAMEVKGLELAAYDPRGAFGQGLAYAVANRGGCHLSAYMVAVEVYFNLIDRFAVEAKPEFTKFFESLNCCINSLQICQFTAFPYTLEVPMSKLTPKPLLGFLMQNIPAIAVNLIDFALYRDFWSSVTGIWMSTNEFLRAGDRIHVLERYMNTREGISRKDDTLPDRLLKEGRACDPDKLTVPLDKMLDAYYKVRGYDSNGIPTQKLLKDLEIIN
ncbi:MAG: aldehyde ferredoxin oxidoreductase family protein [Desulfobacterales bacterium]|nr:aldehyde ferredoxin oxidoreductase family protein [Desulfobacterales bacterium]MBF0397881.1 aldehyde ferredoxin oxidoreductase family protein [Desulfobacterales bacterium]